MSRLLFHGSGLLAGIGLFWQVGAQTRPSQPAARPAGAPSGLPASEVFAEKPAPANAVPATQRSPLAHAAVPVYRADAFTFDAREKAVQVKHGESKAEFKWAVTNATSEEVTINSVQTSCGCTAARLPSYPNPWTLKPGEGGEVGATMDLTGKFGTILKTVTLVTSVGQFPLVAKAVLPQEAFAQMQRTDNRSRNMQVAAADRQAVFRNDCATCHVQPTVGKHGRDLYAAACGICHEAEHRASMVTQLRGRPGSFPREYWLNWIRHGKEGSLMPAFELKKGGPLGDDQIESLASYLEKQFPGEPAPVRLATPAEGAPPSATAAPSAAPAPAATPTAAVRPPAAP